MDRDRSRIDRDRDTMSSATIKTDTGSRVRPGDKRGLPYEVWAIIFSYFHAEDLCRCAMVCKTWNDLVISLDHTRWRDLYMLSTYWRHPFWPLNLHSEPESWRLAYKEQYLTSYFWTKINREQSPVTCMSVFKRSKSRKTITVGVGKEYSCLKSALAVANGYDRIMMYPGIYDEQFEMSSKIPFELIGVGELGSVILVVCIEQVAITGRVSNLVFRAPWFTNFILKVRSGYLQVDNCIMEDGMVYVQNPGSVMISFCTFRHATIILQHVNASIIKNCEFSQTDSAAITVEGFPKEDKNWTHQSMITKMMNTCSLTEKPERQKSGETIPKSAFSTTAFSLSTATTNHKSVIKSHDQSHSRKCNRAWHAGSDSADIKSHNEADFGVRRKQSRDFETGSHDLDNKSCDLSLHSRSDSPLGAVGGVNIKNLYQNLTNEAASSHYSNYIYSHSIKTESEIVLKGKNISAGESDYNVNCEKTSNDPSNSTTLEEENFDDITPANDKYSRIQSFVSDCAKYGNSNESTENNKHDEDLTRSVDIERSHGSRSNFHRRSSETEPHSQQIKHVSESNNKTQDMNYESDNEDNDATVPQLDLHSITSRGRGDDLGNEGNREGATERERPERVHSLSSSEVSLHSASGSDVSEEGSGGYNSDGTTSSSSGDSVPVTDNDSEFSSSEESVIMLTYPERHQPRSLSAQKEYAEVASINSQNQSEHIDIIQDNDMRKIMNEVCGCFIHKCRITQSKGGVMVSLQAHAIVLECEINSVGYGIRCIQNSRTLILKNEIHHCRTSGVFMRLAASGLITGNDIHSNCEAGVDIRKNADPIVQCNRLHHGKRSGVVVLGSGRGQIKHNDIYQNKEAGVYILYRGNPIVSHNQIYSGRAAGIAVNEGGRGYIHENIITGNQWGGVDIRHGGDPVIHHNTVCNGISDGIVIGEGGRGSIENNIITGNAGCGVWIMAAHQPLIHGNEIHSNRDTGISLVNRMDTSHQIERLSVSSKNLQSEHSLNFWSIVNEEHNLPPKQRLVTMATVEYNKVYHNAGKGISVQFGEGVVIQCNSVHGNHGDGITIDQPFPAVVKDNCVTGHQGSGVMVSNQGKVDIRGNGIYDNRDYGICCHSDADIVENDIIGNTSTAIHLQGNDNVKVQNNRLYATDSRPCVSVVRVTSCSVEGNIMYQTGEESVTYDRDSSCTVTNNKVLPIPQRESSETSVGAQQQALVQLGVTPWILTDPASRPHIDTPPPVSYTPTCHMTSITRVTVPADTCGEHGSKFCNIL